MYEYEDIVNVVEGWFKKATPEEQKRFLDCPKEKLIQYHSTLGRDIRNEFKLWHTNWTSELDENGCDCSPFQPDQISMSVIIHSVLILILIKEKISGYLFGIFISIGLM